MNPHQVLRKYFGYDVFRAHQEEIINHLIGGGDAFVLMPTGSGEISLLPDTGRNPPRHVRRGVAAHRPHAGPGGCRP